jgi:ribosomal protein L23
MEYCIHSKGSSEVIDLESDCISYVFSSGRLDRKMEIRDEVLMYYGVKVNHFNLIRYKGKGRMTEEEYLINRRVASLPPY